ncbi:hypothetical protein Lal_00010273 [Lupinus albus]|uniref:Putative F-box domain-containing protein n=1 Tax=Lupinus albus TaxID=3870 RepID=A0A6A4N5V4_LUPAL|nr:putative F-box domain-containing protein [Lupinus albus]KAF1859689.1 hypothetical protein Lal_00010273 [Lupinus albus]
MPPSPIITTLHPDIINSHILTRLDAQTLSSAAASSSYLHRLCTQNNHLWQTITTNTWPSLNNPVVSALISTFPAAHFSIFSDSFPSPSIHPHRPIPIPSELISAVDIYYEGKPVFSRVLRTDTNKVWFHCSPLWIEILRHDEVVPTHVKLPPNDDVQWLNHLQQNLTLSWIMIDPTLKRAANLSSQTAMSARWHWLTDELEVVYAVVFEEENVMCSVKVTCCGKTMGEMQVREVSLKMEDMDARHVIGKDSIVILQRAMESVKKKRVVVDGKERYEKFCEMKRERRERLLERDKRTDMLAMFLAITVFAFFFSFLSLN